MLILNFYLITVIFSMLTIMLIFYALNNNEQFQSKMFDMMLNNENIEDDDSNDFIDFIISIYVLIPIINIIASIALLTTLYSKKKN
ncbi:MULTISPECIES: hypothetical protein [Clostridium]|uniref:Uncharacterized protein n=1 Tax=Clostridium senegalense TaxID=1465809 RepID=A0A6M0H5A1_9CLOT|nr:MULTISPECIES: hypothetical protein [Clostridium]NEU05434.1 hypothetical protein [Clostridium senegalense]